LKSGETKTMKKKRIYQVAKEFNISNEALIDFLHDRNFKVRNHMAPLTDEMYAIVCQNYQKEDVETSKEPDYKRRIQEKREEEEARRQAEEEAEQAAAEAKLENDLEARLQKEPCPD